MIDLGHDQDDTVGRERDGFDHEGGVIGFKAVLESGLFHHIPEEAPGFFCSVSQLAQLQLAFGQILACENAADLTVIYFFNLQQTVLLSGFKILQSLYHIRRKCVMDFIRN